MHIHAATSRIPLRDDPTSRQAIQPRVLRPTSDDRVTLTSTARRLSAAANTPAASQEATPAAPQEPQQPSEASGALSQSDQRIIAQLRQRDREVRAHEMAHLLAAGPHARGGAQFTYETGPDGKRYAVEGAVPIDVSSVPGDPQATLQKATTIRRAALAPAHPSSADMAIAAKASAMMTQARQELLALQSAARQVGEDRDAGRGMSDGQEAVAGMANSPPAHVCGANCQQHLAPPDRPTQNASAMPRAGLTVAALQSYHPAPPVEPMLQVTV